MGVDDSDGEALGMEDGAQLKHRVQVAFVGQRDEHHPNVYAFHVLCRTCCFCIWSISWIMCNGGWDFQTHTTYRRNCRVYAWKLQMISHCIHKVYASVVNDASNLVVPSSG